MSGDASTPGYGVPSQGCVTCPSDLPGSDHLVIQSYRDGAPAGPLDRPVLGICPDCRPVVAELVDTWAPLLTPPVDEASIARGYEQVADECSFCERPTADRPLVGIEYYSAGTAHDDGLDDHRHFALCPRCIGVFSEFLRGLGA